MKKTIKIMKFFCFVLLFMIIIGPLKTNAEETRWFGSQLSGTEREVYNELVKNYNDIADNQEFRIENTENIDLKKIQKATQCFLNDYPEAYWIDRCGFIRSGDSVWFYFFSDFSNDREETEAAIQDALSYINSFNNDFDKIVAINDYICDKASPFGAYVHCGDSIMGGLLNKYGNSFGYKGYSRLFQLLCIKCGIPCITVVGTQTNWSYNYVKYNNKWYFVDVYDNDKLKKGNICFMLGNDLTDEVFKSVQPSAYGNTDDLKCPDLAEKSIILLEDCVIPEENDGSQYYYYTGKPIEPLYTVKKIYISCSFDKSKPGFVCMEGRDYVLQKDKDYQITYSNNINPGTAEATITGLGNCKGTRTVKFIIEGSKKGPKEEKTISIPKCPASVKVKINKSKVTVTWKKLKKTKKTKKILKKIKSIQVQYSTDKKFSRNVINKKIGKNKTKITFKPKKKATYYVRVRYYGKDCVSKWSKIKKAKIK